MSIGYSFIFAPTPSQMLIIPITFSYAAMERFELVAQMAGP